MIVLLFIVTSCSTSTSPSWSNEATSPRCPLFWSERWIHPSHTLSVEIVRDLCSTRVYFNLLICPVVPDDLETGKLIFEYWINGDPFKGVAYVLKGGQRLLLDDMTSSHFLEALRDPFTTLRIRLSLYDVELKGCAFLHTE